MIDIREEVTSIRRSEIINMYVRSRCPYANSYISLPTANTIVYRIEFGRTQNPYVCYRGMKITRGGRGVRLIIETSRLLRRLTPRCSRDEKCSRASALAIHAKLSTGEKGGKN